MIKLVDILKEIDIDSKIYQVIGILTTKPRTNTTQNILSDLRAIEGITIVNNEESAAPDSKTLNHSRLTIKVDPNPIGGLGEETFKKLISDINKIKGVVNFKVLHSPSPQHV